jgi:hypothetical protein
MQFFLKGPKHEIFVAEIFTQSNPVQGTKSKHTEGTVKFYRPSKNLPTRKIVHLTVRSDLQIKTPLEETLKIFARTETTNTVFRPS